jgi:hypothetical protein
MRISKAHDYDLTGELLDELAPRRAGFVQIEPSLIAR